MSDNSKVVCGKCQQSVRVQKGTVTSFYFIYCACHNSHYPVQEEQAAQCLGISLGTLRSMAKPLNLSDVPCSC